MKNRKAMIILVIALLAIAVIVSIPVLHVQAEDELPAADVLFFQRTIKKIKEDKESDDLAEKIAERMARINRINELEV